MKLTYNYRNLELGVLEFIDNNFVYNSNLNNEKKIKEKTLGLLDYHLYNSINKKSKEIFLDFKMWIDNSRNDLTKVCNFTKKDSDWDKLIKIAKTNFCMGDFTLKIINE